MQPIRLAKTWHLFHLIMTLLTGGLWLIIWIWRALANSQTNNTVMANIQAGQGNRLYNEVRDMNTSINKKLSSQNP